MSGGDPFKSLFDQAPVCINEIDRKGRLLSVNPAGRDQLASAADDGMIGAPYLSLVEPGERPQIADLMEQAFAGNAARFEFSGGGTEKTRHFTSCFIPCADPSGEVEKLIAISADISRRKSAEIRLRRMFRAQAVLARCNHSLSRSEDESALLNAFCTNLVDAGGYAFAWIGYVGNGKRQRVRVMAHAGWERSDFTVAALAGANAEKRVSACRAAILRGEPVVVGDIAEEPGLAPWRDRALGFGYRSMIALPLRAEGRVVGNLSIFSSYLDALDDRAIAFLTELGRNLGFGIQKLRSRAAEAQQIRQLRDQVEKEERERIAATLHDRVGQSLQSANLGLKRLRAMVADGGRIDRDLLDALIVDVGAAIGDLRDIGKELRPIFLERMSLREAIRFHCREMSKRSEVQIRFRADHADFALPDRVKEQCFLGFREALGNAIKHGKPSRVDVGIDRSSTARLLLRIEDNGDGFDTREAHRRPTGLGLAMIRERMASVGGYAAIRSLRGSGTSVELSIPLADGDAP